MGGGKHEQFNRYRTFFVFFTLKSIQGHDTCGNTEPAPPLTSSWLTKQTHPNTEIISWERKCCWEYLKDKSSGTSLCGWSKINADGRLVDLTSTTDVLLHSSVNGHECLLWKWAKQTQSGSVCVSESSLVLYSRLWVSSRWRRWTCRDEAAAPPRSTWPRWMKNDKSQNTRTNEKTLSLVICCCVFFIYKVFVICCCFPGFFVVFDL